MHSPLSSLSAFRLQLGMMVKWLLSSTGCRLCWYSSNRISGDGDLDGGGGRGGEGGRSGGEGVLGGPGNVLTMGGGEGGDWMNSANIFRVIADGQTPNPQREWLVWRTELLVLRVWERVELSSESSHDGALERAAAGDLPLKMAPVFWVADHQDSP